MLTPDDDELPMEIRSRRQNASPPVAHIHPMHTMPSLLARNALQRQTCRPRGDSR